MEQQQESNPDIERIRSVVRFFYDLQKLRIQSGNRSSKQAEPAKLTDKDKEFLGATGLGLEALEKRALKEVRRLLKGVPVYEEWLKHQKGCGPTMAGVLLSEIDITRAGTVSALWAYCGLHVDNATGKAVRRERGKKSNWNPFLKTKVVHVLGECLIRANSPWRAHYDNYKNRKRNTIVPVCMACEGTGKVEKAPCKNCNAVGLNAPWGRSDAHRANAAQRYMVKMFLKEFWEHWRKLEGLPTPDCYAEAKLGIVHGNHDPI